MMERIGVELEEAVEIITEHTGFLEAAEEIDLGEALGRVAAEPYKSHMDNPPFDRSPLDGYAFRSQDVREAGNPCPIGLTVTQVLYAGGWYDREVGPLEAARIMTGAPIPPGADCVIRQEEVSFRAGEKDTLWIPRPMKPYENYCFQGEDSKKGTLLLEKGEAIGYVEQGILASAGINRVKVYRKPRIAFFVAGDELCPPGQPLKPGKIYDSNYWLLSGRMKALGYPPAVSGMAGDQPEEIAGEICRIIDQTDLVITTGGVSVGEKDIFHQVLPLLGAQRLFWRVKMKPGTPAMFALYKGKPMIHLSGNPFAAAATFELLAVPALKKLTAAPHLTQRRQKAVLTQDFEKAGGRRFVRGYVEDGKVTLPPAASHASGMLFSMKGCNCLADLPPSETPIKAGQEVEVIRFPLI